MRQTVVMAVAIIGLAAAQVCPSLSTSAYSNTTGCSSAVTYLQDLCTCTSSTWNETTSECTWTNATMNGNCTGAAACFATYSAAINAFTSDTISDTTCVNDFSTLHSCMVSLTSGTDSLWNASGMYTACTNYADTIFNGVTGGSCADELETACATPLSVIVYFTFGGNWSNILSSSSTRRARARSTSAEAAILISAIETDLANVLHYQPTSVTLQLLANDECLATVVLPISDGAKEAFLTLYGTGGSAATALFANAAYWFAQYGSGTFSFIGAGTSPTPATPAPGTPGSSSSGSSSSGSSSSSGASAATVSNVLLALLALVLVA